MNEEQYGQLSLDDVQRIAQLVYESPTFIDRENNLVVIQIQDRKVWFKPLTNPAHIVKVTHKVLERPEVVFLKRDGSGNYVFFLEWKNTNGKIDFKECTGETIWKAASEAVITLLVAGVL